MDYARRQFSIKDNVLTVVVASYASKDCKPEELDRALILSGSFELAGAAPRGGSNLNYSIQSVSFVALSEHGVIVSNMGNGTCAIKDYVLGGAREVKDVNGCDYLYTAGVKPFSIIGVANDLLSFGNYYSSEDIGTTAEKRPDSFAVGEELQKTATPIFEVNSSTTSPQPNPQPNPSEALTLDSLLGQWSAPEGVIKRGSGAEKGARQVRFGLRVQDSNFQVSYALCEDAVSCSGGDLYGRRVSGTISDGKFMGTCIENGVTQSYEMGGLKDGEFTLVLPDEFQKCTNGTRTLTISRDTENKFVMALTGLNYSEVIVGGAVITKN